ncbi:MAG: presqualene diphosphate synthase HpnD, partial [Candidatus Thermoplasmatota archaeon]|nr:presqualene diphosphate synthase HpnD [Candidatus Thermoplasmatota archaeon]
IIRDVGEDARRGRIYLPQDELARFGAAEADLLTGRDTPEFQAEAKLDWWRAEIGRFAAGVPEHPATRALFDTPQGCAIPSALLLEIVDGMAMDLDRLRYPDFKSLNLYCYRVAGVVGEVAAAIFGGPRSEDERGIRRYAHELGLAFQLTNIIRDVGEDARRGRIYLPQDELARFGAAEADLLTGRDTPEFQALMQFQFERASAHYESALAALPASARRAQRPGLVMAAIYRTLLEEIRRSDFPVLRARVALTPLRKLWIAGSTWLFP